MRDDIVLIGPLSAGKTTLALYISARLGLRNYPLDRIKWYYRFRNGYDLARGTAILRSEGFGALLRYAEAFFTLVDLARFLEEFQGGVIDFGASQSVFEDAKQLEEARGLLEPFRNVILVLPSSVPEESFEILSARLRERYSERERAQEIVESYIEVNRGFVYSKSNRILAKRVIYTGGKTIEETGEEIIASSGLRAHEGARPLLDKINGRFWGEARNLLPPFG